MIKRYTQPKDIYMSDNTTPNKEGINTIDIPSLEGNKMIAMNNLKEMIELVLYTGYLKGEQPVSLIIVAKAESGKTEVLSKFVKKNKGIAYISDATSYGILKNLLPDLKLGTLKHIIIPDLISPLSRRESTVKGFISFLNGLIEEGIVTIHTYATEITDANIRCGVITAITNEELRRHKRRFLGMGFMTRLLPFSYSYDKHTVIDILKSIMNKEYMVSEDFKLKFPKMDKEIKMGKEFSEKILPYTVQLAEAYKTYGFRLQKQLQRLMMANALKEGRTEVSIKDFEKVKNLTRWLNLEYNSLSVDSKQEV